MTKRTYALAVMAVFAALVVWPSSGASSPGDDDDLAAFKDNQCVKCHSSTALTGANANRYLEWHLSTHKNAVVSCDKCHGGNPAAKDKALAHAGVRPPSDPTSRVNAANVAETCRACHEGVVTSFVQSAHYQKLKTAGLGPSCTTCHEHMASAVVSFPSETAALCAQCHDAENGPLARNPQIPKRAGEVMESFDRANGIVVWADRLVEAAPDRKVDAKAEAAEMTAVHTLLGQAKNEWHTFLFDAPQKKADQAFADGTKVKDKLMKRLGFTQ